MAVVALVEVVKEAGPYVVALAGMGAGYFGGRSTGRESRHHARVEALYQDMLDDLAYRSWVVFDAAGIVVYGAEAAGPEVAPVSQSRVRLYASPSVSDAWNDALFSLHVLDSERRAGAQDLVVQATFKCHDAERALLSAMRDDLGVPRGSLLLRARRRVGRYRKAIGRWRAGRRRRRAAVRLGSGAGSGPAVDGGA